MLPPTISHHGYDISKGYLDDLDEDTEGTTYIYVAFTVRHVGSRTVYQYGLEVCCSQGSKSWTHGYFPETNRYS